MSFGIQGTSNATALQQQQQQQDGTSLRPFANLNLSDQQRSQMRSIFQSAKSQGLSQAQVQDQINAVLTPSQQQTLQSDVLNARSAHSGHHHHQHGAGGSGSSSSGTVSSTGMTDAGTDSPLL